jgi:hypothetical protein
MRRAPLKPVEHSADRIADEDDWQTVGAFRAHDAGEPGQIDLEHVSVQEQEGIQGPVLSGGDHPAVDRQRGEEAGDSRGTHLSRMALGLEEEDVALVPGDGGPPRCADYSGERAGLCGHGRGGAASAG